jgi:undecaprenyl-diphosphatase
VLVLQSIVLGIVQGLTEFIPISSSAHLVVIPWLFGWEDPTLKALSFDVALHLGTLVAVLAFFAKDWARLVGAGVRSLVQRRIGADPDRRMAWFLVIACVPGAAAGLLFEGRIERLFHPEGSPISSASMLAMAAIIALLGALLFLAEARGRRDKPFASIGLKSALLIGLAQAAAVFPGVSRSGSTITAGLALGLERGAAARFSFLLGAPIIAGAGAKSLLDLAEAAKAGAVASSELVLFPIGFAAAALSGFFCIKLLLGFLQKHSTRVFVYYRWVFAALIAAVALTRP